MDCKQVRAQLYQGEKSPSLWWHLLFCRRCRTESRALHLLEQALSAAPRPEPPATLLGNILAVAEPAPDLREKPLLLSKTSRLAFWLVWAVIAALLALSFAVTYIVAKPKPNIKPEAPTDLTLKAAPIPGKISSISIRIPTTVMMELWMTPRAAFVRTTDNSGTLISAQSIELDTNKSYYYNKGTQYAMDLAALRDDLTEIMARSFVVHLDLKNREKWYHNDCSRATIEYNTPRPDWTKSFEVPPGTKTVTATAKIQQWAYKGVKILSLETWVGDRGIVDWDVPMKDE